jgi:hypothetical protein
VSGIPNSTKGSSYEGYDDSVPPSTSKRSTVCTSTEHTSNISFSLRERVDGTRLNDGIPKLSLCNFVCSAGRAIASL